MSEEEAIERLKERVKLDRKIRNNKIESDYEQFCENECQAIETILNRADKQQKEIEELKSIASEFINRNIEQFSIGEFNFKVKHFKNDYIHKDKIREKLKELEEEMKQDEVDEFGIHSIGWGALNYVVEQLQELLEEN